MAGHSGVPCSAFRATGGATDFSSKDQLTRLSPPWPDTWWNYGRAVTGLTELFAADQRLPMARWPNDGDTTFGDIIVPGGGEDQTPTFRYEGERPERWRTAVDAGLWLYGYWRRGYRAEFIRVKSLTPATKTIELAARNSRGDLETGGANRYCAMSVLEELDMPGEWRHDAKIAAEGERFVKTWHSGRFIQTLAVTQGQPVTVRARGRAPE